MPSSSGALPAPPLSSISPSIKTFSQVDCLAPRLLDNGQEAPCQLDDPALVWLLDRFWRDQFPAYANCRSSRGDARTVSPTRGMARSSRAWACAPAAPDSETAAAISRILRVTGSPDRLADRPGEQVVEVEMRLQTQADTATAFAVDR